MIFLSDLTKQQKEAVTFDGPALMIVAGAGTGKTTTITKRIAWLIEQGIEPSKILALAFNEKAVAEMETRVDMLMPMGVFGVQISTFHSFCHKILQQYPIYSQVTESSNSLDDASQKLFFNTHIMEFTPSSLIPLSNPTSNTNEILRFISRCKDELISPDTLKQWAIRTKGEHKNQVLELAKIYDVYQKLLQKHNLLDFGELHWRAYQILSENRAVRQKEQNCYTHILVDEYQDTNHAQIEIIKLLHSKSTSITVVGDDDQAIYRFRGATTGQMTAFAHDFKAETILLTDNFRSGQKILDTAYTLIQHNNPHRLEAKLQISKKLISRISFSGDVVAQQFKTDEQEAAWIADDILYHLNDKNGWDDFCILVRTNHQSRIFAEQLTKMDIPFTSESNLGLAYNPTIRLLLNYLKTLANPEDSQTLFFLAVSPIYELKGSDIIPLFAESRDSNRPLELLLTDLPQAQKLLSDIKTARDLVPTQSTLQLIENWLKSHTAWQNVYAQNESEPERQAVNQFLHILHQFDRVATESDLFTFLHHADALLADYSDQASVTETIGMVRLYTVHQAKGLEFTHVYVTNLTKEHFPLVDRVSGFSVPSDLLHEVVLDGEHLREERRLFYVAATRAKQRLILTRAAVYGSTKPRSASIFWSEIGLTSISNDAKNEDLIEDAPPPKLSQDIQIKTKTQAIVLSAHALSAYISCPLKYRYQQVDRVPTKPNQNLMVGQCVHAAIEHYFNTREHNLKTSVDELMKVALVGWESRGFISKNHEIARQSALKNQLLKRMGPS